MQKKKTELLELLGNRSLFDYGEEKEILDGLGQIEEYFMPKWFVGRNETFKSLVYAFLYGAMMGIRHERKKRKEKANRAKGGAF